jgi:hypothetical protein
VRSGWNPLTAHQALHDLLGYRSEVNADSGVYWRADPEHMGILDGDDDRRRAELIAERLRRLEVDHERLRLAVFVR